MKNSVTMHMEGWEDNWMAVYVSHEAMEERTLMVIRKYNVLYMKQLLHFLRGKKRLREKQCRGF